jgi:transcriptional regulator with XRE-family HTH domain
MHANTFAVRLRTCRLDANMTQADLALRAGLQPSAISHFESGRRAPSLESLTYLVRALGVPADRLLGTEGRRR